MASTVGHALCGVSCLLGVIAASPGRSIRCTYRSAGLFAVLANLPDIDFIAGYLLASNAHAFHQGATHTLIFAAAAGLLVGCLWGRPYGLWPASVVFIATILSHDVIDMLTGPAPGFNRSPGLALFWPFDTTVISAPVTIFPGINHLTIEEFVRWHNVVAVAHEIVVFMPVIALLYVWGRNRGSRTTRAG
ncbi:MAG TPA: metal-dependent hydrolase [Burkholderiales bacterium]|jgi:membrane-bound metal-dependent hydrolase YbcI (DUF457 family)|nr:metal-dependent hydrolase [Burkholderiales bacterium]HEV8647278.1 metal-dependent hydrolase [Burkholderiales bacterium]